MEAELMHDAPATPEAIYGDGADVIKALRRHGKDATVVAVVVPSLELGHASAIGEAIVEVVNMVPEVINRRRELDLQAYLNLMLPKEIIPGPRLQEMKMLAAGMRAVIESGDFVNSTRIAELADFSKTNPSAQPSKWKREKAIFSITYQREDYFPLYALQQTEGYRPHRRLKDIIKVFDGKKDGWGIALWFLADNSYLGGRRPQDVLKADLEAVLAAAHEEVGGVLHG